VGGQEGAVSGEAELRGERGLCDACGKNGEIWRVTFTLRYCDDCCSPVEVRVIRKGDLLLQAQESAPSGDEPRLEAEQDG
jgi:predicted amidophosphoribosyltransferase